MEEGLVAIKSMPPEFVKATEKAREKERRKVARENNMETLRRESEERRVRSLERARVRTYKPFAFTGYFVEACDIVAYYENILSI